MIFYRILLYFNITFLYLFISTKKVFLRTIKFKISKMQHMIKKSNNRRLDDGKELLLIDLAVTVPVELLYHGHELLFP